MIETVCVTGASGYLGSHVVTALLSKGYNVIAAVRDKRSVGADYLEHIKYPGCRGNLEIIQADYTKQGSYDDAFHEADYLIHTAANTSVGFSSKPASQNRSVDDNIVGTRNIIESINRSSRIRRIIYTSSMAAVFRSDVKNDYIYDETDWNDEGEEGDPYFYSKTQAELMFAVEYENRVNARGPDLIRFNPSVIFGPFYVCSHQNTSISILSNLVESKSTGCPRLYYNVTDVRDLAGIYVEALHNELASGRYLIPGESISLLNIAKIVSKYFPDLKMPKREFRDALVYSFAGRDAGLTVEYLDRFLGVDHKFNDAKIQRDFRRDRVPLEDTIKATIDSMQQFGKNPAER